MSAFAKKSAKFGAQIAPVIKETDLSSKTLLFFREVSRCLPTIIKQYKLAELTSLTELRRNVSNLIRRNERVIDPSAIDILIYKGREELEMILMNHKQRHHLVSQYVKNPALDKVKVDSKSSEFLQSFYRNN